MQGMYNKEKIAHYYFKIEKSVEKHKFFQNYEKT